MKTTNIIEPTDDRDDNPEYEKGPTHRANDKGATSENAQLENSDNGAICQERPNDSEPISHDAKSENSPGGSVADLGGTFATELTPKGILSLRLPASELEGVEGTRVRTTITVGKPPKDQFFRVKDGADYWVPFGILDLQRSSSFYLVSPGPVRDWLKDEGIKSFFDCVLCLAVTRHGGPFVWPLKQTSNTWHETARSAAEIAKTDWIKLISDQEAGYYLVGKAASQDKEPAWPAESFEEILEKAFAGRIVDSLDHEVIKELRGDD